MNVMVVNDFEDLEHRKAMRKAGQVLNVSEERAEQIIKAGYGRKLEILDLDKEADKKEVKKEVKKSEK